MFWMLYECIIAGNYKTLKLYMVLTRLTRSILNSAGAQSSKINTGENGT